MGIPGKRGPYRLRDNTLTCSRCGTKHKKNKCPKRIPRGVRIPRAPTRRERIAENLDNLAQRQKEARFLKRQHAAQKRITEAMQAEGPDQWAAELMTLQTDHENLE